MARTPQQLFDDHLAAVGSGDLDRIVADYREDAVLMTADGVLRGHAGIRAFFEGALAALPDLDLTLESTVVGDDALLVRWGATSSAGRITDAVDTLVVDGDRIRLQTSVFRVEPPG